VLGVIGLFALLAVRPLRHTRRTAPERDGDAARLGSCQALREIFGPFREFVALPAFRIFAAIMFLSQVWIAMVTAIQPHRYSYPYPLPLPLAPTPYPYPYP